MNEKKYLPVLGKTGLISLLISIVIIFVSCETVESEVIPESINLQVNKVSCSEVWLDVHLVSDNYPVIIDLRNQDSLIFKYTIPKADTTIYYNRLEPNKGYDITITYNNTISNNVSVVTKDTSSNLISWEVLPFGYHSSSLLDVEIINENNIWVVGEIHTRETGIYDSNGVFIQPFNAVHWDGNSWQLKRLLFEYKGSMVFTGIGSVKSFADDDILFGGGIHWDGNEYHTVNSNEEFDTELKGISGSSGSDYYISGDGGKLAHYDGNNWDMINNEFTDLDFVDLMYEDNNSIWIVANSPYESTQILQYKNNQFNIFHQRFYPEYNKKLSGKIAGEVRSLWSKNDQFLWALSNIGIQRIDLSNPTDVRLWDAENIRTSNLSGSEENDLFYCGLLNGSVYHFNGIINKKVFSNNTIRFTSIESLGNTIVCTATDGFVAYIVVGKR